VRGSESVPLEGEFRVEGEGACPLGLPIRYHIVDGADPNTTDGSTRELCQAAQIEDDDLAAGGIDRRAPRRAVHTSEANRVGGRKLMVRLLTRSGSPSGSDAMVIRSMLFSLPTRALRSTLRRRDVTAEHG
jgi:hypothetical protein